MLTDRQRVELALPARLWFGIAASDCFSDPQADQVIRVRALLKEAANAPLDGLMLKEERKVAMRIDRAHEAVARRFYDRPALGVAMALFYFLEDLLSRGVLELFEGSPFAEAFAILAPMFEDGFDEPDTDQAARDAAAVLLADLKALGYFADA